MFKTKHIFAALMMAGFSSYLPAETLNMPAQQESTQNENYAVQVPGRGMTMENVMNKFGEPVSKEPAVGDPPITRWDYTNFTVYFESEYVIHAVVKSY